MDYQHKDVDGFWHGWIDAIRKHPGRTLGLLLATTVLGAVLVIVVAFLSSVGSNLAQTKKQISSLTNQIAELKVNVHQAVNMKQEMSQTINLVTKVEKEIANIKETIDQLYSRFRVDVFRPSEPDDRFCGFVYSNNASCVAVRLTGCPVVGSIQGIWGNKPLFPTSIRTFKNVLITVFSYVPPPTNENFSISYMIDPEQTNFYRKMEVRDNVLYLDGQKVERSALP